MLLRRYPLCAEALLFDSLQLADLRNSAEQRGEVFDDIIECDDAGEAS